MGSLQAATIQAPSKGMDIESAPASLDPLRAPLVKNMLPGRNGRMPMRGQLLTSTSTAVVQSTGSAGVWTNGNFVLLPTSGINLGTRVTGTTGTYSSFGTVTILTFLEIGKSYDQLGGNTYGYGINRASSTVNNRLLKWDGGITAGSLVAYTNAPLGGVAVKAHLNRLWVVCSNNGAFQNPANVLRWSDDGGPTADTTAVWQDDVTGLDNIINLPSDGDTCVGLAVIGRNLLILRTNSLWMLTGTSPDTFDIRRVSAMGCDSVASIVEYNDGVFFSSKGQMYYYDGATVKWISEGLRTVTFQTAVRIDDQYILAGACPGVGVVSAAVNRLFLYHVPTGSWSELTSTRFTSKPSALARTTFSPFLLEGAAATLRVWDLSTATRPDNVSANQGFDTDSSSGTAVIPARVTTRFHKLSSPLERAKLERFMADYTLVSAGDPVWRVTATDDVGTTLFTTDMPAQAGIARQRYVIDQLAEIQGAVQLDIQMIYATPANGVITGADLQDLTVVYETTRQRTG